MVTTLDKQVLSKTFEIVGLEEHFLTPKLEEMGLYVGKRVRVLFKAPLGCPIALDVEGYTLSLRLEEAKLLKVRAV